MFRIPRTAQSLELSYRSHAVHRFKTEKPLKLTCPVFKGSTSRSKKAAVHNAIHRCIKIVMQYI